MRRSFLVAILVVAIGVAAVPLAPPAWATAAKPTWLEGDYWEWRVVATAPGISNGTIRMQVTPMRMAWEIGGRYYPSWVLYTTRNFTSPGPVIAWTNQSGSAFFNEFDLGFVKEDAFGTREGPGGSTTVYEQTESVPPQPISWPLTPGWTWSWWGWMNTTSFVDSQPQTYTNMTVLRGFVTEPEETVTVPAGTFAATPVNATDVGGDTNVTYWSSAVGNYVLLRSYSMGTQIYYMELVSYRYYVDVVPPTIADVTAFPGNPFAGGYVNVSARVTDDTRIAGGFRSWAVYLNVTQPDGTHVNETMAGGASDRWYRNATRNQVGAHTFLIWAADISGKWASASGSFSVQPPDTERPQIAHTPPAGPIPTGTSVTIQATVTDDDRVAQVWLEFTDVSGGTRNVTMTAAGNTYAYTIPAQSAAGTVRYRIIAVDPSGNVNTTQEFTLAIENPWSGLAYGLVGIVILAAVLTAAVVLRRRGRKAGGSTQPPSTPP